jgi:hypothetical protein
MIVRAILVVIFIASVVVGQTRNAESGYTRIEVKDFIASPASFENQTVAVNAEVISVRADYTSLSLFDGKSRTLVIVSLAQLPETKRRELIDGPARRITVIGKLELVKGRVTMTADKAIAGPAETLASN